MEVVEIPTTVLFDEMQKKLGLPGPVYKARVSTEGKIVASVAFYPATRCLGFVYGVISLGGNSMDTLDAAYNDAAKQAIRYMEKTEQKIMKDYNYDQLNEERLVERNHVERIILNNRETAQIIKEKDQKLKEITKQWDDFIEDVSTANDKIYEAAQEGYTSGVSELEKDINSTLSEIQSGTEHVKHLTFVATDVLRQIGKFPYHTESESGESAPYSGCFESPPLSPPGHYIRSCLDDEPMYDSDGLSCMEDLHL